MFASTLYIVWDADESGITGIFDNRDAADAHAKYKSAQHCRTMLVVEYIAKDVKP